ncbi:MAG: helix-turn-helix domain-containing protein [Anaerobutyricum soehngenii]
METKDIILELHKKEVYPDELDTKVMVTRQAVSRWENGETIPNMENIKTVI